MYQYLIVGKESEPFFTNNYSYELIFSEKNIKVIVYDLFNGKFTKNGIDWDSVYIAE